MSGTAVTTPFELSRAYIDAYNRRDIDALRALIARELEYVRPGPVTLTTIDEVMAQYESDWETFKRSRVDIRSYVEADDVNAIEITCQLTTQDGKEMVVEGVVFHKWCNGQLIRYRAYFDPFPTL